MSPVPLAVPLDVTIGEPDPNHDFVGGRGYER